MTFNYLKAALFFSFFFSFIFFLFLGEKVFADEEQVKKDRELVEKELEQSFKAGQKLIKEFVSEEDLKKFKKNMQHVFSELENLDPRQDTKVPSQSVALKISEKSRPRDFKSFGIHSFWESGDQTRNEDKAQIEVNKKFITYTIWVKQVKNRPFSLKVEKGVIHLNGTVRITKKGKKSKGRASAVSVREVILREDIHKDPAGIIQDTDGFLQILFSKK